MQAFNIESTVATLRAFAEQNGIEVSKKANKDTLIALVNAFVAEQNGAEQNAAFRFPKASDFTPSTAVTVVRPAGWSHIEAGNEETAQADEGAEEQRAKEAAQAQADEAQAEQDAQAEKADAEKEEKRKRTLSEAIAETWKRPEVARARKTRDNVQVTVEGNTEGFSSVWKAFEYYGLPAEKHIKFRGALKKSRKESFSHDGVKYDFEYDAK
jgi:hypothetical protein